MHDLCPVRQHTRVNVRNRHTCMAEGGGEDVALPGSRRGEEGGKGAGREGIIDQGRPRGGKKVRGAGVQCYQHNAVSHTDTYFMFMSALATQSY